MSNHPEMIYEERDQQELKVTFFPPLFLQRRIWILDTLRAEDVTKVLDVGCGEGQLLTTLCQPAPWLNPPLPETLPSLPEPPIFPSLAYGEIPDLHPTKIYGLDISLEDLLFAVQRTAPPQETIPHDRSDEYRSRLTNVGLRWEELEVRIWKGRLEIVNEDFVGFECIVATEVIEHLPPHILPAFAPALLGTYHPRLLLVTTPSFTFNARFTAPTAPPSVRRGYPDPTCRTDRIFRHHDHKFEWTIEEFQAWCQDAATEWGYEVQISNIGRAVEVDEWGRDEELSGATLVAVFKRLEREDREERGREALKMLALQGETHELLVEHHHTAHPRSRKPSPLREIARAVKGKMEEFREAFMRLEELWFEQEIATMCGGWIEWLVRAVEESEFLFLKRDLENNGGRSTWVIELVGGISQKELWPDDGKNSPDCSLSEWIPRDEETESMQGEWEGSTHVEGDISGNDDKAGESEWSQEVGW